MFLGVPSNDFRREIPGRFQCKRVLGQLHDPRYGKILFSLSARALKLIFFRHSKYSYRFLTIINELSEFENPYLDLKIVFLSHLEAEILKN